MLCCVCFQLSDAEEASRLMNASSLSDTVLPSTPESPGEMFVSPLSSGGPSRQVAHARLSGVSRLMKTPKQRKTQSADASGLSGVKQLMKTPKVQKSPSLEGVKKLVTTPKEVAGTPELDGIRSLLKTPKPRKSADLVGVKQLLKTPKAQKSPALDGVKRLVRTPKDVALSPKLDGLRKLVKTPKAQKSPRLSGMKKLLKTPKTTKSPQLAGLKTLMKTPKQQQSPIFAGVRQLMKTPKSGPKSPDFVGVSEMLASPETSGSVFVERSTQKSVAKKKRGKLISSDVSAVPSPRARGTRGRKIPEITTELHDVEAGSPPVRRTGASNSKSADGDDVIVTKKVKSSKPSAETEVSAVISARKGKSRGGSKDAAAATSKTATASEETVSKDKVTKASSTPVGKVRSKRQLVPVEEDNIDTSQEVDSKRSRAGRKAGNKSKRATSEVVVDVGSSPKMPVKSRSKSTKKSKKTADAGVLSASTSVDQTVPTGLNVTKSPEIAAAKKSKKSPAVVSAGPSPRRLRTGGQASKSTKSTVSFSTELSLDLGGTGKAAGRKKTQQSEMAKDSVNIAQQVGSKNSRAARKPRDTVLLDHTDSSAENIVADVAVKSKGSRGATRIASPISSKNKAARQGRVQDVVTELAESVTVPQKGQEGSAAVAGGGGRRGQRQPVHDEPQPVPDNAKMKTPSGSKKRTQNADKSAAGQRRQPVTSVQELQSSEPPVSTRRGKRQIMVEESLPAVENVKVHDEEKKQPDTAAVAGKRRGMHNESVEAVTKTTSRNRKRPQTVEAVDAPESKSRRKQAEESVAVEQPMKQPTKTKQSGKSSSQQPDPKVSVDRVTTGRKLPTNKSGRSKVVRKLGVKVVENSANSSQKSSSKNAKKLKDVDNSSKIKLKGSEKKKLSAKMVVETAKKAVVSPRATRSKRTKR